MPTFDPTTASGHALAELFRTWCRLRDDPGRKTNGTDLTQAVTRQFTALGLDTTGPATQVDESTEGKVFTVFGLRSDEADHLMVAVVLPGEHTHAIAPVQTSEDHYSQWADTITAESPDTAADIARRQIESGDYGDEPAYPDTTPSPCAYPKTLLNDLRHALVEWFDDNPDHTRPHAVSFGTTTDHDDGPTWNTSGPTLHYDSDPEREERRDIPVDHLTDIDFENTAVADTLGKIADFRHPQTGDTLRITLPARRTR